MPIPPRRNLYGHIDHGGRRRRGGSATKTAYITVTSFSDVPADNWAWKQIEALVNSGIAQGNGNGTYTAAWIVTHGPDGGLPDRGPCAAGIAICPRRRSPRTS